jgi:hypothetical protein
MLRHRSRIRRGGRAALPFAGAALGMLVSPVSGAQAWIFDPRIEVEAIYDDNYRLTSIPGQEIEVTGGAIDAELAGRKEWQAAMFEIAPRIRSTFFPDESSEESTDYFLNLLGERRTQRTKLGIRGQYADESVVTSELPVADFPGVGLGQPTGGDAGRTTLRNRRALYLIQPTLDFDWTERRQLSFEAHYVQADYDDNLVEQVGYKDVGGSAGIGWNLTQRSTFSIDLLGARYEPDDDTGSTTSTGLTAEWRTAPSQVTDFYFRVGSSRAERDSNATDAGVDSSSFNGGVGVAWNFQVTRIVIDALRATVPSSQGEMVDRDELRFRVSRTFSPRFSGFVALRGIRTEGVDSDTGTTSSIRERKYYTGRTGFEWRMNRQYALEGMYEYKWQEYQGDANSATSNGVMFSVVYQPRRVN